RRPSGRPPAAGLKPLRYANLKIAMKGGSQEIYGEAAESDQVVIRPHVASASDRPMIHVTSAFRRKSSLETVEHGMPLGVVERAKLDQPVGGDDSGAQVPERRTRVRGAVDD